MGWWVLGWWENDIVYSVRGWKDLMGWGGLGVVEGMRRSWGSGGGGSLTPSGVSLVSRIT